MAIPDGAIVSGSTVFLTGVISTLGLIISKENKTSEFRQAWVDALRADLAAYVGHLNVLSGLVRLEGTDKAAWLNAKDIVGKLNTHGSSIFLRLNPKKETHEKVRACIRNAEAMFQVPVSAANIAKLPAVEEGLLDAGQCLLKSEWERVKDGEITFRVAKWVSIVMIALALLFLVTCLGVYVCKIVAS